VDLLRAGKHVLVEKPMATCLEECDAMLGAAQASGRLLSVVAQNRFKTPMMKLKRVLESGLIGRVLHAQVTRSGGAEAVTTTSGGAAPGRRKAAAAR